MLTMKDDAAFNIRFAKALQKYPSLYNLEHPDYNNKDVTSKEWAKLADELGRNIDVEDCKTRWRNIRGCLKRYLRCHDNSVKNGGKPIRKYYLHDHLSYVLPFTAKKKSKFPNNDLTSLGYSSTVLDFEKLEEELKEKDPLDDSNDKETSKKQKREEFLDNNYWQLDVESPTASTSTNPFNIVSNPDLDFFKSILEDLSQFSPKKKREFKRRVLHLIDEISDET